MDEQGRGGGRFLAPEITGVLWVLAAAVLITLLLTVFK
jgi:hypothetical protein